MLSLSFCSRRWLSLRMSREQKRFRGMTVRIGTHDGSFHCDEVLACFLLRQLPEYREAEIVRSRNAKLLAECDVVVDVGGEYAPERHRYDHHQRTFTESMYSLQPQSPWVTKLSSAGLVYHHFGKRVLSSVLEKDEGDPQLPVLYNKMYQNFIEEIDAIDNGISQYDGEPRYALSTNLSSRVSHLNPSWNDEEQDAEACFCKAMELVGTEFLDRLQFFHKSWLPARALVEEAIRSRCEEDASGEILVMVKGGCPWKEHLFNLEKELKVEKPIKFVLYVDQSGKWRVQCVPKGLHTFQNRLSLPEEWRGVRDEALSAVSGIPDCVFVHTSGFIGGNKTKAGALEMARRSLREQPCAGDTAV